MLSLGARSSEPEHMDAAAFGGDELVESFRFIELVNRFGGGRHAVINGLRPVLRGWPAGRPVEVVDVGCGTGDLGVAAVRWGRAHHLTLRYLGVDRSEATVALARKRSIEAGVGFVAGDLFDPQLPTADVVMASMVLHHLDDDEAARAIRHLAARARVALIINDLERSIVPYGLCRMLTWLLRRPESREDALLSIRRGFTLAEMRGLLARAGVGGKVRNALGWRLLAIVPTRSPRSVTP